MKPMMPCTTCDGQTLKHLARAGLRWLEHHYQHINSLNVFPIPDGDTGINMLLTMRNAYQEVEHDESNDAAHIAKRLAHGAIMGSRGNSGTIMSQIWRGFESGLGSASSFDVVLAVAALREAQATAYRGVQQPVEGTILTVIREIAEEADALQPTTSDFGTLLEKIVARGQDAVARTPELLPILKEAGVVDAGGAGLMLVFEGMLKHLRGETIEAVAFRPDAFEQTPSVASLHDVLDPGESGYNYDVQFVLLGHGLDLAQIKSDIEAMGDSAVIAGTSDLVKVHVHVDDPAVPIGYAVARGRITDVVVENMQLQYEAFLKEKQQRDAHGPDLDPVSASEIAVVAVVAGQGLASAFADLGASALVYGGQTINPSTQEILSAVQSLNSERIIILPNNKNIVLAAEQAARLAEDKSVEVVPTRTLPQGIAAMLPYRRDDDLASVVHDMNSAKDSVVTVEITTAIRSADIDGVAVSEGQVIALLDGKLCHAADGVEAAVVGALGVLDMDHYGFVSLYYGNTIKQENADPLLCQLQDLYQDHEFQLVFGGQAHYHYIIGVEI